MTSEERPDGSSSEGASGESEERANASSSIERAGNEVTREQGDPRASDGRRDAPPDEDDGPVLNTDGGEVMVDLSAAEAPAPPMAGDEDPEEPGDDEEAVEPVELLVQLAERGEIDPWAIDLVEVTDKFLAALDEADLRAGGRALFYASVLLRMKSDAIMEEDEPEPEEEWEPWEHGGPGPMEGEWDDTDPFDALEEEMDRRLERKRARGMPRTLDELVRELREAERGTWWKERRTYDTSASPKGFRRGTQTLDYRSADEFRMDDEPTAADVTGTAHGEHMETTIRHVYRDLREQYDHGRAEVLFEEVRTVGGTVVETFLALLFLTHRGQVYLDQDELFGDLWIQDPEQNDQPTAAGTVEDDGPDDVE